MKVRMLEECGLFEDGAVVRCRLQVQRWYGWWCTHATYHDMMQAREAWSYVTRFGVLHRVVWMHDTETALCVHGIYADDCPDCKH